MKKNEKLWFLSIVAVLLLIFTFTDLQISKAVYNPQSGYGHFFEAFGELPGALIGVFSLSALIVTGKYNAKWKTILFNSIFGILLVMFSFMAGMMPLNYLGGVSMPVAGVLAAIYAIAALLIAKKLSGEENKRLREAAVIGILTFVAAIVVINIIKMCWGRLRFRSMLDPAKEFTLWFIPQGFTSNNEYMSFPSGHSANSAVIMWITLLPTFVTALRGKEKALKVVAAAWIVMVMVSRVIMGAHFASDVTVGASISICCFYLISSWVKKRNSKTTLKVKGKTIKG